MMPISNRLNRICTMLGPGCSVHIYDDYLFFTFRYREASLPNAKIRKLSTTRYAASPQSIVEEN
jgi:hypothetical protein